jgi:hypothetical protein
MPLRTHRPEHAAGATVAGHLLKRPVWIALGEGAIRALQLQVDVGRVDHCGFVSF